MGEHKTTGKGYLRFRKHDGRLQMEHRIVWEEHYGKIPEGMQIHHIDGDKTNNDISNLQLLTPLEHSRIHDGCIFKNNTWYKPCKVCGEYKPATTDYWYFSRGWINGQTCKACYIRKVVKEKQERKRRQRIERETAQMTIFDLMGGD